MNKIKSEEKSSKSLSDNAETEEIFNSFDEKNPQKQNIQKKQDIAASWLSKSSQREVTTTASLNKSILDQLILNSQTQEELKQNQELRNVNPPQEKAFNCPNPGFINPNPQVCYPPQNFAIQQANNQVFNRFMVNPAMNQMSQIQGMDGQWYQPIPVCPKTPQAMNYFANLANYGPNVQFLIQNTPNFRNNNRLCFQNGHDFQNMMTANNQQNIHFQNWNGQGMSEYPAFSQNRMCLENQRFVPYPSFYQN